MTNYPVHPPGSEDQLRVIEAIISDVHDNLRMALQGVSTAQAMIGQRKVALDLPPVNEEHPWED